MEKIMILDKVNRVKNTEIILHLWIWTDDIKKEAIMSWPPFHIYQILFII